MLLQFNLFFMEASEILRNHKLKKTSPRVAIIEALQSSPLPMGEDEISSMMGSHYDRTTFYRSALTLEEAGILHRIVIDKQLVKYALNEGRHNNAVRSNHAHFFCNHCQKLICLENIHPGPYRLPEGFQSQASEVIIKGLCSKCN